MTRKKSAKEQEKELDKELKDTFPASDPLSGNIFTGAGAPDYHRSTKKIAKR